MVAAYSVTALIHHTSTLFKFAGPWPRACQIISLLEKDTYQIMRFEQQLKFKYFMKLIWNNFRFWIQFSTQFTFSSKNSNNCFNMCSNNCFLLEQFLIVCLPPGASWHVHRVSFESRGSPFVDSFFGAPFLVNWAQFWPQNGAKMGSRWTNLDFRDPSHSLGRSRTSKSHSEGTLFRDNFQNSF